MVFRKTQHDKKDGHPRKADGRQSEVTAVVPISGAERGRSEGFDWQLPTHWYLTAQESGHE